MNINKVYKNLFGNSLKLVLVVFSAFVFLILLTNLIASNKSVIAACGDPGCGVFTSYTQCTSTYAGAVCTTSGGYYIWQRDTPLDQCGGCPNPSFPWCTAYTVYNPQCGTCCGGGGGGNQQPIGYHDGAEGVQPAAGCRAFGWAVDPDNRDQDLTITVLDRTGGGFAVLATGTANMARGDLTGQCPGGTCAFDINLNGLVPTNSNRTIQVQALDINNGVNYDLATTYKVLNCQPGATIQGFKRLMPGNTNSEPAASQTISITGGSVSNATSNQPFVFGNLPLTSLTASSTTPAGYTVGSTLCYNRTDCHSTTCVTNPPSCPVPGAWASGASRSVDLSSAGSGGYADLWWHYTPVCSCNISVNSNPSPIDTGSSGTLSINASATSCNLTGVNFVSNNTSVLTVNPATDSSAPSPYTTTVTGVSAGSASVGITGTTDGGATCTTSAPISVSESVSCNITSFTPNPLNLNTSSSGTVTVNATSTGQPIQEVRFYSDDTGIADVGGLFDTSPPYQTDVQTFGSTGTTNIRAECIIGGVPYDFASTTVNVSAPAISCNLSALPNSGVAPPGVSGVSLNGSVSGGSGNTQFDFGCLGAPYSSYMTNTASTSVNTGALCNYSSAGTFTPGLRVTRGGAQAFCSTNVILSPAPVCSTPTPIDPPAPTCDSGSGNGSVTWQWNSVASANEYEIDIFNSGGTQVINNGWTSVATYGCGGGGTCSYTTTLAAGTYYSRIRARGSTCTASNWGQSNNVTVDTCGSPTVNVSVTANPNSGNPPLSSTIQATVTGTATGNMSYTFSCFTGDPLPTVYINQPATTLSHVCNYSSSGNYTAQATVTREGTTNSGFATITCTDPPPGQCTAPTRPFDPVATSCTGGTYSAIWEWDAVWDPDAPGWAAEYQLQVDDSTAFNAPLVENTGWLSAASFGCSGGGVCSYTSTGLTAATSYYSRVRTRGICSQSAWSANETAYDSCGTCTIDYVTNATVQVGGTASINARVTPLGGGTVDRVVFSSNDTGIAAMSPADPFTDNTNFSSQRLVPASVTGVATGTTDATVTAYMDTGLSCDNTAGVIVPNGTITITPAGPWWQVRNADVLVNGGLGSNIPNASEYFNLTSLSAPAFPGVPIYSSGVTASFGSGEVSDPSFGWIAGVNPPVFSAYDAGFTKFDYDYFNGKGPQVVCPSSNPCYNALGSNTIDAATLQSGGTQSQGYYWYRRSAPGATVTIQNNLTLSGGRRVVLFVNGDVALTGNITLTTPGSDVFMLIASGNITVPGSSSTSVTNLDGVFIGNTFRSESGGASNDNQLTVNGSIIAWGTSALANGISLERDLGGANSSTPAELINYLPQLTMAVPSQLFRTNVVWREINP